jgi:hypothetical protein
MQGSPFKPRVAHLQRNRSTFTHLSNSNLKTTMPGKPKSVSTRSIVEPQAGDKRYVRRKEDGTFGKTVDVGDSLAADRRQSAKTKVGKGQGDRGDRQ